MPSRGPSGIYARPEQKGVKSSPTTSVPYEHYIYEPNTYIAIDHPDFVYRPAKLVEHTEDGELALEAPLDDFFATYETFTYNAYASVTDEFNRLLLECLHWDVHAEHSDYEIRHRQDVRKATKKFNKALFEHFRLIFGVEYNSFRAWQVLFKVLGANPLPETEDACRMIIQDVYVNMIDVLDAVRINRLGVDYRVPLFKTERALSEYSLELHRIFPLWAAERSGLLKVLLRRILDPSEPTGEEEIHPSFEVQRRKLLNRLAAKRVRRHNARSLEVALAVEALARLEL
ncbi:unnamed protein product [Peniophora sp. CBMAI 1063]|nr:unnamed protein product [Peniophora sp. CBMAI 1063]